MSVQVCMQQRVADRNEFKEWGQQPGDICLLHIKSYTVLESDGQLVSLLFFYCLTAMDRTQNFWGGTCSEVYN